LKAADIFRVLGRCFTA